MSVNRIPESLLVKELRRREGGASLLNNLERIKLKASPILERISIFFSDYTRHDASHSDQVLENLDWIIPSNVIEKMNNYELYVMIMSCYVHDLGMAVGREETVIIRSSTEFQIYKRSQKIENPEKKEEEILKDYIREIHHIRSEKYILENYDGEKGLSINDLSVARAVAIVAKGHREEDLLDFNVFDPKYYVVTGRDPVCLTFLACCLRLADELDITRERTPELLFKLIEPENPISIEEWEKHRKTLTVGPDGSSIKIQAVCENPKIHKAIINSAQKIQSVVDLIHRVLRSLPKDLHEKYKIALDNVAEPRIKEIGYIYREFKFEVDANTMQKMFMGDRLYPSKYDCVRELLENSVDTCRLKYKIKADWKPQVRIGLSDDKSKLWVEDNGMGMDEFIIENFLMRIGKTFYDSYEYKVKYGNLGMNPISEFGIGFLSCFMIADCIVVETLMNGNKPIRLEVDSLPEDFVFRKGSRDSEGTTVELYLNQKIREELDDDLLEEKVRYYARHIEFPITVVKQNENEININDEGFDLKIVSYLKPSVAVSVHPYEIKEMNVESTESLVMRGKIGIALERDEEGYSKLIKRFYKDFIDGLQPFGVEISSKGFYVKEVGYGLPLAITGCVGDIDIEKSSSLNLNLSRNSFSRSGEQSILYNMLQKEFSRIIRELFEKDYKDLDREKLAVITNDLIISYINWRETDIGEEVIGINSDLVETIEECFIFVCFAEGKKEFLNVKELLQAGDSWILLRRNIDTEEIEIKQCIENIDKEYQKSIYILGDYSWVGEGFDFLKGFFDTFYDRRVVVCESNKENYYEYSRIERGKSYPRPKFMGYNQKLGGFANKEELLLAAVHLKLILNTKHPFIQEILNAGDVIYRGKEYGFFNEFFDDLSRTYDVLGGKITKEELANLIDKQRVLIDWLVKNKYIDDKEAQKILISKRNFPSWLFEH